MVKRRKNVEKYFINYFFILFRRPVLKLANNQITFGVLHHRLNLIENPSTLFIRFSLENMQQSMEARVGRDQQIEDGFLSSSERVGNDIEGKIFARRYLILETLVRMKN